MENIINNQPSEQKSNFQDVAFQIAQKTQRHSVLFTQDIDFTPKKENLQHSEVQLSELAAEKKRLINSMDRLEKIDQFAPMNKQAIQQHQRDQFKHKNNEWVKNRLENNHKRLLTLKKQAILFEQEIDKQRFIDQPQSQKTSDFKRTDSKIDSQFETFEIEEEKAMNINRDHLFKNKLESVEEERIFDRKKSIRKLKRQMGINLDKKAPQSFIEFNANDFQFFQQTKKRNLKNAVKDIMKAKKKEFCKTLRLSESLQEKWNRVKRKLIMLSQIKLVFDEIKLYGTSFRVETSEKRQEVIQEFETLLKQPNFNTENATKKITQSKIRVYWTIILILLFFYTSFITPYRLTFVDQDNPTWRIVEYIINIIFFFDMILTFNSAYYNDYGELISSRYQITINYLKSWFLIDLISIFPFEVLPANQNNDTEDIHGVDDYFRLTRLPKLYRLFRLARLIKMVKKVEQNKYSEMVGDFLKLNAGILRIIIFLFTVIVSVHISGCLWYYAAKVQSFEPETWVYEEGYLGKDDLILYIASIYWSVQTIATVGFGDITPHNDLERIVCLIWQIFGVGFFTFTVGSLSEIIGVLDTKFYKKKYIYRQAHLENKITMMDEFCEETNLSKETRLKIRRSLSYASQKNIFTKLQRDQFLSQIPLHLRYQVAQSMFEGLPQKLFFFQNKEPIFLAYFVPSLQPLKITQGELIYQKGEHPNLVYFLVKGRVNMVIGLHQITFKTYVQGSYFGEVEILDSSQRLHTARTEIECEFLTITASEFMKILSFFPDYDEEVKRIALQKLRGENEAIQKMQSIANLGYKSEFWRKKRKESLYQMVKERKEVQLSKQSSFSSDEQIQKTHMNRKLAERFSMAMIPIEYHRSLIPQTRKNEKIIFSQSFKIPKYMRKLNQNQTRIEVKISQYVSEEEQEQEENKISEQLNQPNYLTFSERWLSVPKSRIALLELSEEKIQNDNYFDRQVVSYEELEQQLNQIIEMVTNLKQIKKAKVKVDKETQTQQEMLTKEVQTDLQILEWDLLLNDLDNLIL